eukprot:s1753_g7.t1
MEGRKRFFQCQVDLQLSEYQWLQPGQHRPHGDLAVLSCERGDAIAVLQGSVRKAKEERNPASQARVVGQKQQRFTVEVELSEIAQLALDSQEQCCAGIVVHDLWRKPSSPKATVEAATAARVYFILVPANEKTVTL